MRSHLDCPVLVLFVLYFCAFISFSASADGWDPTSQASTKTSIVNTRHNLTVSYSDNASIMDVARNNYAEVCVYCHTPHAANSQVSAPLWNRTINTSQYDVYNKPRTLNRPISQPGPNSLTCLSCHDGTIAIDSIINMPGSGKYDKNQETDSRVSFLDTWTGQGPKGVHYTLGPNPSGIECTSCHNKQLEDVGFAPDYTVFTIGTDLTDDHPIGILYPVNYGPGYDFAKPDVVINGKMSFFDTDGNGFANTNEVRVYDSGEGPEVECASCHDPHGVPSGGKGSRFNPSFLRVNNGVVDNGTAGTAGIVSDGPSALCLTCHTK